MKDFITGLSRILVGTLFVFSGIIKANDPLGFSYKLEEYWIEFGMGWDWLLAIGVPLASLICILEIVLGIAVLVVYRFQIVTWLMLLMIVFFTILTFASAVFGLVKSCGCFGDAIPLTPWQSFIKDLVLMALIGILFKFRHSIKSQTSLIKSSAFIILPTVLMAYVSFQVGWAFPLYFMLMILALSYIASFVDVEKAKLLSVAAALVASVYLCFHAWAHLPLMDFRPYAVNKNISEQMKLPEGAKPDVYANVFKYKNSMTGEVEEFTEENYPWDDTNYVFVDRTTTLLEKGDEAKITDFSVVDGDGFDITEDVLQDEAPLLLLIFSNIGESITSVEDLKILLAACEKENLQVLGLTASSQELIDGYVQQTGLSIPFYATDEITLKTMVRSNPGIMLLKKGAILGKWHVNDVPDYAELLRKL